MDDPALPEVPRNMPDPLSASPSISPPPPDGPGIECEHRHCQPPWTLAAYVEYDRSTMSLCDIAAKSAGYAMLLDHNPAIQVLEKGGTVKDPSRPHYQAALPLRCRARREREDAPELNGEADFRTRGNKRITLSGVYRILNNPFYYGMFEYPKGGGNWYKGTHAPLITKELFEEVRAMLAVAPRSRYGSKDFAFTKMFQCGIDF
jgi:hypothetical protein